MNAFMRWFRRGTLERQLDTELAFHVDQETARLVDEGVAPVEARRRALARFGGVEPIKEQARDARGGRWLEALGQDVRYSIRMMRRSPGFTFAAVASLAIGIGANAALFSVADALVLRTLPVDRPDELSLLARAGYSSPNYRFSGPLYRRFVEAAPEAGLAAMHSAVRVQIRLDGAAELAVGQLVTGNWFDVLGVRAAQRGRLLTPADTTALGAAPVVVLSHAFWTQRFAASPAIVGSQIAVNGVALQIVGVAPRSFAGLTVGQRVDMWMPVTMQHELHDESDASIDDGDKSMPWLPQDGIAWLSVVMRAPDTAPRAALLARLDEVRRQAREQRVADVTDPDQRAFLRRERLEFVDASRGARGGLRDAFSAPLGVLMTTVAIVLLIGCANLASLLLARGTARGREIALRLALGANRGRIARQLLTESLTLAGLGGLAGLAVAAWGSHALLALASSTSTPIPLDVGLDARVLVFTLAVSLLTGVLFGVMPSIRLSGGRLADSMRAGARLAGDDAGGRLPWGRLLVAAQVALSLLLLVGAVLFLRTFRNLASADAGIDRSHIVSARFDPRLANVPQQAMPALHARLLDHASSLPGVRAAALALAGPLTGAARTSSFVIDGEAPRTGDAADAREDYITPQYFEVMGMRLLKGRAIRTDDVDPARPVAVVSEAFVRKFIGSRDPIGRWVGYDDPPTIEIVGVVADAHVDGIRTAVPPILYHALAQRPDEIVRNLYVRTDGDPAALKAALQRAVTAAEPGLAVREVVTLDELADRSIARERLVARLTAGFGLVAVFVACVGLYGTVSYSVARRTRELGVRVALGAAPGQVRWLVLRDTLRMVFFGSVAGIAAVLGLMGSLQTLVFGLSPRDPWTIAAATAGLTAMGLLAGLLPAWRASRVDPLTAIRD
jgi:predicted permease